MSAETKDITVRFKPTTKRLVILALLLLISILIAYGSILKYPFVADDWFPLEYYTNHTNRESIKLFLNFSPGRDIVSYRPVGYLYVWIMYKLFGLNAFAFKIIALLFHFVNSLFLINIVRRILKDDLIVWASGFLYATSLIHSQPLIWSATGFFDYGGMFFFFLSFFTFLKKKYVLSVISYSTALLTKPAMGVLPFIMLFYIIFAYDDEKFKMRIIRRLWCHFFIAIIYGRQLLQYVFYSSLNKEEVWSYVISFGGKHLFENFIYYLSNCIFAIFPLKIFALVYIFFIIMLASLFFKKHSNFIVNSKSKVLFWIAWFILALIPALILKLVKSPYYTIYPLPAFIVLFLLFIKVITNWLNFDRIQTSIILIVTVMFSSLSSGVYLFKREKEGVNSREHIIRTAYTVKNIQDKLLKIYPSLPKGAVLLFEGRDVYWAFSERNRAPRTWYKDITLEVSELNDFYAAADDIYIKVPAHGSGTERIQLDSNREFFLINWNNGDIRVRKLTSQEVYQLRSNCE